RRPQRPARLAPGLGRPAPRLGLRVHRPRRRAVGAVLPGAERDRLSGSDLGRVGGRRHGPARRRARCPGLRPLAAVRQAGGGLRRGVLRPRGMSRPLPVLRETAGGTQLVVDGRPVLLLGGQLHNSSASSPAHMLPLWDRLAGTGIGTVIGTASWAQVEPVEGTFDFSTVDAQIAEARARGLRLVLIWFGAFKNAASTYAPGWVRADLGRFPRAAVQKDRKQVFTYPGAMPKPVLSVFGTELLEADRRAFVRFLQHLAAADPDHVVVMVQVENEVGLLGDSRDRSPEAEAVWKEPVPGELIQHLAAHHGGLRPE